MKIDNTIKPADLTKAIKNVFQLAEKKVKTIDRTWDTSKGTPVFTVDGKYTTRGWTEWTQGFVYGCAVLTFDATGHKPMLELGRQRTLDLMAPHVTHIGVHDHGFNNLSSYGNLRRLMLEGRIKHNEWEMNFYEMALKASGAVQAARWADVKDGGYICSFNGPQSLFIDTIRSTRILGLAHQLGHCLMAENDVKHNLLARSIIHGLTTSKHIIFYGDTGHTYDVRGRTAHEGIFNRTDGVFRCRSTQQGYSPFSTWTRGLAWAMVGYAEELEFFDTLDNSEFKEAVGMTKAQVMAEYKKAAKATCDHYIKDCTSSDGVCYWDDGAPGMAKMPNWQNEPADPYNEFEPVDSTASAIGAQGLLRLGKFLGKAGKKYTQAGLTVAKTLMDDPYLATSNRHQGLLLHSIYHQPNGWDNIPKGKKIQCDESSMWGDYHLLELANLIKRTAEKGKYPTFFDK